MAIGNIEVTEGRNPLPLKKPLIILGRDEVVVPGTIEENSDLHNGMSLIFPTSNIMKIKHELVARPALAQGHLAARLTLSKRKG